MAIFIPTSKGFGTSVLLLVLAKTSLAGLQTFFYAGKAFLSMYYKDEGIYGLYCQRRIG